MSRLTTPFGARSTAAEVIAGVDLTGKRVLVTGATSGIGLETALALATAGAEVTLTARDTAAGERAAAAVSRAAGHDRVHVAHLDLADRGSIDALVKGWTGPLDVLVNNAGVMAIPDLRRTADGWEEQLAVNHLGTAALTLGLHPALAAAGGARVVTVSSSAHLMAPVDVDDLNFTGRPYEAWTAYAQSKTASILFTVALAKRWAADGITVNALHPGGIRTNLQRHLDDAQLRFVGAVDADGVPFEVPPGWKTPAQGAATTVLLAASPLVEGVTGRYFEDANEVPVLADPAGVRSGGVAAYAVDPDLAERLWEATNRLLSR
ncbi:SDR family NAD(P)-dependent oxidoreductase [Asanoa siamensis]|uniref:Oxidoreductase n=1 Tax=Asanoa siamensis TaxID=926357 RepID=A0ABQ4CRE2_9ACTN|nr:SDR family NAD(P)-dependent oxidoreductase [Asanoa siamensis]GIF73850.1 oxidoreductase [Asanoa siamensis]